ncbi:PREDICTED: olfactory receptor 1361-like [Nanorana parkeri]|uniref:olfactory receptor 1361-like n=1 Tax=Nanorana parkeri TaxID=125878 RepID=UPI000854AB3A|nr:PREDICTED: olfactory receptor 1361-like [Nanorana parkeri]
MESENSTLITEFVLSTFSDIHEYQTALFAVFLLILMITVTGNLVIIVLTCWDSNMQSPMYFYLGHLSFVDICLSLVTVPQMLKNFLLDLNRRVILFEGCMAQIYFFLTFANVEDFLLAVMAYDRYVAICDPLHYTVVMSKRLRIQLIASCWLLSTANSILHTTLTSRLSYCRSNLINHFLCDMVPLFQLSCSSTIINELVIFTEGSIVVMGPFLFILVSYIHIILAIFKIHSAGGRSKVFSTCSSHLSVVIFYFGTIMFTYFRPSSSYSLTKDRVASVMYMVLAPMLNPFIYSLRNKDVKQALQRLMAKMNPV